MNAFRGEFLTQADVKRLPSPPSLASTLGPGVILLATAVGSGEILFWPGITATYGFQFVWLVLAAVYFQYVLNTEFMRYTLATGEPVVLGFSRLWKGFGWFFLAAATLPWMWPGWATGAATALTWEFGGDVPLLAAISLLIVGLVLSTTKIVYKAMELSQKIMLAFIIAVAIFAAAFIVRGPTITALGEGFARTPFPIPSELALPTLLAALAFCGAGGTINLAVSNWARDKGMGLGAHAQKVTNPFSGEEIAVGQSVFRFEDDEENRALWRRWWRLARREQQVTFLSIGVLSLLVFMAISYTLIGGQDLGVGIEAVFAQGEVLGQRFGSWVQTVFSLMVFAVFFTSSFGVLDQAARISSTVLSSQFSSTTSKFLSESAFYFMTLWGLIAFGVFVLLGLDVSSPPFLLTIAGSLSGIVMFVYSVLMMILNVQMANAYFPVETPNGAYPFRLSILRWAALIGAVLLYGTASLAVISTFF